MKIFLGIMLFIALSLGLGFYLFFQGNPIKKHITAKKIEKHIENKYKERFKIKSKWYNFKDGNYGAVFYLKKDKTLVFDAQKRNSNGEIQDYYLEKVWEKQFKEKILPTIDMHFLNQISVHIQSIKGIPHDLNTGEFFPNFKEVAPHITVSININDYWSEQNEKKEAENVLKVIKTLKEKEIFPSISVYFKETQELGEKPTFHSIFIKSEDFKKIKTIEDILSYSNIF